MKQIILLLFFATFLEACLQTNIKHLVDNRSFEKIIFHTTSCAWGACPTYHLELGFNKNFKLFAETVYKSKESRFDGIDKEKIGYYKGTVSDTIFAQLNEEIKNIGLDTLEFDGSLCCDGVVFTIIVYFDGKRKYFESMFPPEKARKLISLMYNICEKSTMMRSQTRFTIENPGYL